MGMGISTWPATFEILPTETTLNDPLRLRTETGKDNPPRLHGGSPRTSRSPPFSKIRVSETYDRLICRYIVALTQRLWIGRLRASAAGITAAKHWRLILSGRMCLYRRYHQLHPMMPVTPSTCGDVWLGDAAVARLLFQDSCMFTCQSRTSVHWGSRWL